MFAREITAPKTNRDASAKASERARVRTVRHALSSVGAVDPRSLEAQADALAELVVGGATLAPLGAAVVAGGPALQRKCTQCEDEPCPSCLADQLRVQRKPAEPARDDLASDVAGILVDDGLPVGPRQMARGEFMARVRAEVTATCDDELARVGRSAADCPYLRHWLDYYDGRSAAQIERAVAAYSGIRARDASALIDAVVSRVRAAVRIWTATGAITGIPSQIAPDGPSAPSGFGADSARVQAKAIDGGAAVAAATTPSSPAAVRARLGRGQPLDAGVRARMERGFGHSFASVRVHTDSHANGLASSLSARAFTIGSDVAFSADQYRPGTLAGDLLIAHELAHTIQQGSSHAAPVAQLGADDHALEDEADHAALGALVGVRQPPRERGGGLRLQRCGRTVKSCPPGYSWRVVSAVGAGPVCDCYWRCLRGKPPGASDSNVSTIQCPPEMACDEPTIDYVDADKYEKKGAGKHAVGAHMTPLDGEAACGCLPLDMEGKQVSDVPLRPSAFEMTDVVGPLVEVAAGRRAANRETGQRQPEPVEKDRPRPQAPMTPPPEHVAAAPPKTPMAPPVEEPHAPARPAAAAKLNPNAADVSRSLPPEHQQRLVGLEPRVSQSQPAGASDSAEAKLIETLRLRGRQLELGIDFEKGGSYSPTQAEGGVHIEQGLGREIRAARDIGADFDIPGFGPVSLKGPLPPGARARANVTGLIQAAIKDVRANTATRALFVDLIGLSEKDAATAKAAIVAGTKGYSKPVLFLERK